MLLPSCASPFLRFSLLAFLASCSFLCRGDDNVQTTELVASFNSLPSTIRLKIGTLKAREVREFLVRARNETDAEFIAKDVTSSCSCAAASVGKSQTLPGGDVEVRIRIAVPNSEGVFRRQVAVKGNNEERIDFLLEGDVEMPFSIATSAFAISDTDRLIAFSLTSNEGMLKNESLNVACVTQGIRLKTAECQGETCKIELLVDESYRSSVATMVLSARLIDDRPVEQQFVLRIREKQNFQLKPRVLRFSESAGRLKCSFFIYGEKEELEQLLLSKVEVYVAESESDVRGLDDRSKMQKLEVTDIETTEYGIAGTFVAERRLTEKARCFVRLAIDSGAFLDERYVVFYE
jgi:hypothetical protein